MVDGENIAWCLMGFALAVSSTAEATASRSREVCLRLIYSSSNAGRLGASGADHYRWPEVPNFIPSCVRRHEKYSSSTFIESRLGTGPTRAV